VDVDDCGDDQDADKGVEEAAVDEAAVVDGEVTSARQSWARCRLAPTLHELKQD
jgi:hypothetical protein